MKKIACLLSLFILLSCSVQKRHYQKGYYISWNKRSSEQVRDKEKTERGNHDNTAIFTADLSEKTIVNNPSSVHQEAAALASELTFRKSTAGDSCEVMIFRDGSEVRVKIIEISATQVKYKKCDLPDGPLYVSNKSELFMITYLNGTKEVFKEQKVPAQAPSAPASYAKTRPAKKNTKLSTLSLVFSILGFYPAIFVGGLAAIIMALIQLNKIAMHPELYGGEKKARVALILGIVSVIAWGALIALFILTL